MPECAQVKARLSCSTAKVRIMCKKVKKQIWAKLRVRNTPRFRYACRTGRTGMTWGFGVQAITIGGRADSVNILLRLGPYILKMSRTKQDPRDAFKQWPRCCSGRPTRKRGAFWN